MAPERWPRFITQTGVPHTGSFDLVLSFATDTALLANDAGRFSGLLGRGGRLWAAYPKGKAVKTDLNRDTLRAFLGMRFKPG